MSGLLASQVPEFPCITLRLYRIHVLYTMYPGPAQSPIGPLLLPLQAGCVLVPLPWSQVMIGPYPAFYSTDVGVGERVCVWFFVVLVVQMDITHGSIFIRGNCPTLSDNTLAVIRM